MIPKEMQREFLRTVKSGGYNLLLGSGISLDSYNGLNEELRSAEQLRRDLCEITGVSAGTSLNRVASLLSPDEKHHELVTRFSNCVAGSTLDNLSKFIWRRLFTFNIDDAIENHYEKSDNPKQLLASINYDSHFEPTPDKNILQAIHLHGWSRKPDSGFVFSTAEYARTIKGLNPWMHMLGEILSTEPFIIAGTSLNEVDLEYYLRLRTPETPRRSRGPSILIEPKPDRATIADCERYGLQLVVSTFGEFLDWLSTILPAPPSVAELVIPDVSTLFSSEVPKIDLLKFFSDFELVCATDVKPPKSPSAFLYGRAPEWIEIHQHLDIERESNSTILNRLSPKKGTGDLTPFFIIMDEPGTGKSTCLKRVAHDIAATGRPVFALKSPDRIDVRSAISCLSHINARALLMIDGLADHIEQIAEIVSEKSTSDRISIIGTDRSYRRDHLELVLAETGRKVVNLKPFNINESRQLLERYMEFGLAANHGAVNNPERFVKEVSGEPVAVTICRILNDFQPFDRICQSLWKDATEDERLPYLVAAIAQRCHRSGIRYSILQSVLGTSRSLTSLISTASPLGLTTHEVFDEFVIPANPVVAERLLISAAESEPELLFQAFQEVARGIAPYVNRRAIKMRSPEARLAGRLFDADKIVKPLLIDNAEEFYISVQQSWEWNSRYWEQRALLMADRDIFTALTYARHAVAVERHPFALTTLGKLLFRYMELPSSDLSRVYEEAKEKLVSAIEIESGRSRVAIQPYSTLLSGTSRYIQLGGILTGDQTDVIRHYMERAQDLFGGDPLIKTVVAKLAV